MEYSGTIIAEIGSVHDGSFGNACKLIDVAASCGADIVKFQTHIASAETLPDAPEPPYFKGEPRAAYFERTGFSEPQWIELKARCGSAGVRFMSSPFSLEAVDLLERVGAEVYKVPSGEVTNLPLLLRIAQTGKPVYLSSGMSNWAELDAAIAALRQGGPVTILQCTTAYPCPPERIGLNVIREMQQRYQLPVGFSDHALGSAAAFAAAALGATAIEKHLTFSTLMYGSDAANAMEPEEFRQYCHGLKSIWRMLKAPVDKDDLTDVAEMKPIFEKSVVSARNLAAGHVIAYEDLAFKKPGDGIPASAFRDVVGRRLRSDVRIDRKLRWDDLA